ncbi:MAG: ribonuclease D [Pseudomonadota bacterium]
MDVVTSTDHLAKICTHLARAEYVTVDTEFMRESTYWPNLCLIQMAGPETDGTDGDDRTSQNAYIVDPLAGGIDLAPFYALMADEGVVKVFHAARQDVEIVHGQAGVIPLPIFDTQVAAMVCGFGESISYSNLVKAITSQDIDKSSRFTDWARRPLSDKQLRYALGDVTHLRAVYTDLNARLEKTGRAGWLREEMTTLTTPQTYETQPADAWRRLKLRVRNRKGLAVLMELAAWREQAAQDQNVPRQRVLRDEALYDIANQMPERVEQLAQLRTLSDGFARSARAKDIIQAVAAGRARDMSSVPPLKQGRTIPSDATAIVDLLRVLLKACASRHDVAAKLIATTDDLEAIALDDDADVAALRGWRREMFGEDALKIKRGDLALSVEHGRVTLRSLTP